MAYTSAIEASAANGGDWQRFPWPAAISSARAAGRLYQVAAVVLDGDQVGVYCVEVSALLASELQAAWAGMGRSVASGRRSPLGTAGAGGGPERGY